MSGGSLDYISGRLEDVADRLNRNGDPLLRALGAHVDQLATVLHDVEWFLSCDTSKFDRERVRSLIGQAAVLQLMIREAETALENLTAELEKAKA